MGLLRGDFISSSFSLYFLYAGYAALSLRIFFLCGFAHNVTMAGL